MAPATSELTLTLPSDREIVMTREFDAPRELVFKALVDPNLIPRWWGPRNTTTIVDEMDVRVGGAWRFIHRGDDGESGFHGEYREIVPPERIVQTFEWEGLPGHVSVDTLTLEEVGGKTRMTASSTFENVEDRDGMLQSGMESGARETWDRLAELLNEVRK